MVTNDTFDENQAAILGEDEQSNHSAINEPPQEE